MHRLHRLFTHLHPNSVSSTSATSRRLEANLAHLRAVDLSSPHGLSVSTLDVVRQLGDDYQALPLPHRRVALLRFAGEFGLNMDAVKSATSAAAGATSPSPSSLQALRRTLTPPYESLFAALSSQPGGLQLLLDMRRDLLAFTHPSSSAQRLVYLERDLFRLLSTRFASAYLHLTRVTWQSPAALLEKLVAHESVHRMDELTSIKTRLGQARRCFAFFHPALEHEPLVFVHVALMPTLTRSIHDILDRAPLEDEGDARAAIFYSINATQPGLRGIDLGNALIKRVTAELRRELPNVDIYSTLSPIPGFATWLRTHLTQRVSLAAEAAPAPLLSEEETGELLQLQPDAASGEEALDALLDTDEPPPDALQPILERLCKHYLLHEKRRTKALDPVANFHLKNGGTVASVNAKANHYAHGIKQSFGFMVNYRYHLGQLERNSQAYINDGIISSTVQ